MSEYDRLKKVIPPDQALANQALSRSLRQVKKIFDTNLPDVASAVSVLESNVDLDLINDLNSPLPAAVANFWGNTFPTGTGPGNTITTNDTVGIAAGVNVNDQLPIVTDVLEELNSLGALNSLTGNGGMPSSINNGVYTVMSYCLANAYTTDDGFGNYTITIPVGLPGAGTYGPSANITAVFDDAFGNGLIPAANSAITSIAAAYNDLATKSNSATDIIANQLAINQTNLSLGGIDIGNIVIGDFNNANIVANQISSSLSLTTRLHDIGIDVSEGGPAQFFEQIANTSTVSGQAVIASMREGRNIAVLNAVGIVLDTQLSDVNPNAAVANNLSQSQYTVDQATANIVI